MTLLSAVAAFALGPRGYKVLQSTMCAKARLLLRGGACRKTVVEDKGPLPPRASMDVDSGIEDTSGINDNNIEYTKYYAFSNEQVLKVVKLAPLRIEIEVLRLRSYQKVFDFNVCEFTL